MTKPLTPQTGEITKDVTKVGRYHSYQKKAQPTERNKTEMKIPDWHIYTCPKCKEEWAVDYDFDCPHCYVPTIRGEKCNKIGEKVGGVRK